MQESNKSLGSLSFNRSEVCATSEPHSCLQPPTGSSAAAAMHAQHARAGLTQSSLHPNLTIKPPCHVSRRQLVLCAAVSKAAVGIDLGTTNSVVAVLREGEAHPTVIHDSSSGSFTVPSVVSYNGPSAQPLVGAAAKQQAASNPSNTFYSVKRLMGRSWEEVQGLGLIYGLTKTSEAGVQLVCPATDSTLSPQQVSADLLRYLVDLASQHLSGNTPQQVVITVPAYFNAQQRAATLEAAKLAGIPQVSLLQEPVAAAMAFGFGKPYDAETLLVFDLGGGTFDLSVVDSFEGIMEVLATGGDALLGGDDFDRELLQGLLTHLAGQHDSSSSSSSSISPEVLAELLAAVEAAKCQLSTQETVQIPVSAAAATQLKVQQQQQPQQQQQQQQDPATIQLSRQRMHELTAGLRQRLWQPLGLLADACKLQYACSPSSIEQQLQRQPQAAAADSAAGSNGSSTDPYAPNPRQLTAVVLVGGATRMPIIQQGLQVLTGLKPRSEVDPEQAVALGAAIQAAVLLGLSSGVELMDGSYVEEFHNRSTGF